MEYDAGIYFSTPAFSFIFLCHWRKLSLLNSKINFMNKQFLNFIKYLAVAGNIIFILFILYKGGIDKGFNGTIYQKISTIVLLGLLAANSFLIIGRTSQNMIELIQLVRYAVICGNVLIVLWMLFNGIHEGFKATLAEKIIYLSMFVLLAINSMLLFSNKIQQTADQP